jgi:hypothetical protein
MARNKLRRQSAVSEILSAGFFHPLLCILELVCTRPDIGADACITVGRTCSLTMMDLSHLNYTQRLGRTRFVRPQSHRSVVGDRRRVRIGWLVDGVDGQG